MSTINGGTGDDSITGTDKSDSINAYGGNDTVFGGLGNDTVQLGDGNDSFGNWNDEGGDDLVYGGAGADTIIGGGESDTLYGGTEGDVLSGGIGDDKVYGGAGNDALLVTEDHQYDYFDAGEGNNDYDEIWFANWKSQDGVKVTFTGSDAGSYTYGGSGGATGDFIGVEAISGTGYGDTIDASASTSRQFLKGHGGDDTLRGGAAGDEIAGGDGDDQIWGGAGNDMLDGGSGSDTIEGGIGNDSIRGGDGDDKLAGDDGADTIDGGDGNDVAYGGAGNDQLLDSGVGNDLLYGGAGDDVLWSSAGTNELFGGDGADRLVVQARAGDATLSGGEGGTDSDRLVIETEPGGSTVVFSGSETGTAKGDGRTLTFKEIEAVETGDGDDLIDARASTADQGLYGGSGGDTLLGGAGSDTLEGGRGDDSLRGGAGRDTIVTGSGRDTVGLDRDGGSDVVTDFDTTRVDGRTTDQLDVSDLRNPTGAPVTWRDVKVTTDPNGNAVLNFPEGETIVLQGVKPSEVTGKGNMAAIGIPCFVAGTRIATPDGPRPVETLRPGDRALTASGEALAVLWAGGRRIGAAHLRRRPELRPLTIDPAPGAGAGARPLRLSPQHAMAVRLPGGEVVLARCRHLLRAGWPGVRETPWTGPVDYHHLLLSRHALLLAEEHAVESLWPGPVALAGLPVAARIEIAAAILAGRPRPAGAAALAPGDLGAWYGPRALPLVPPAVLRMARTTAAPTAPAPPDPAALQAAGRFACPPPPARATPRATPSHRTAHHGRQDRFQ